MEIPNGSNPVQREKPYHKIRQVLKDFTLLGVNVFKTARKLEVVVSSKELVAVEVMQGLEKRLSDLLGIDGVHIKVKYNLSLSCQEILTRHWDSIQHMIIKRHPSSKGLLTDCSWAFDDPHLKIYLKNRSSYLFKKWNCDTLVQEYINNSFGHKIMVDFTDAVYGMEQVSEHSTRKQQEMEYAFPDSSCSQTEEASQVYMAEKKSAGREDSGIQSILGKDFDDPVTAIADVSVNAVSVAICGDIFRVDSREVRGDKILYIFDITDYKSSLTVKFFISRDDADYIKETLKENLHVKVRGQAQFDKFSNELVILASDIMEVPKDQKMDHSKEKRVELHLHTQMSAMDGITAVDKLVERAAFWGHKAIAITDHGVVQAFPDAAIAGKMHHIKVIYGMECYLTDDHLPVVCSSLGQAFDDAYVVFDVETTGLDSKHDQVIEIGAVKIKNRKVIDKFSSFVNPTMMIPEKITALTGISQGMVKDAPGIDEVLTSFLVFAGDAVLVAHNASFDMGFIRKSAKEIGRPVRNSVLDTLQLCRGLFPGLSNHKLQTVAEHLQIELENHHRAVDDSEAAGHILLQCLSLLSEQGAKTIDDIENYLSKTTHTAWGRHYHAILLAATKTGLKNLYKLVTRSHLEFFSRKPRIPKSVLQELHEGLLIGTACESGELYQALLHKKSETEIERIIDFYDYLEIQPLGNNEFLFREGTVSSRKELEDINKNIVLLGDRFKKKVVAAGDVHFMDPGDEVFRRILMAGKGYSDAEVQAPLFFRTTEEMLGEFAYLGDEKAYEVVVTNPTRIADQVEEDLSPIPAGTYPPSIEGAEQEIERVSLEKAREIYGFPLPEIVQKRLERELTSIIKNGFSVMYIIAHKLVAKSLSDGYIVGSRGSVGSSFAATMCSITEVNPLPPHYVCPECKKSEFITDGSYGSGFDLPEKNCPLCGSLMRKDGHDIPFETFLGFEGEKSPDIDLNFSGEYQPKAHKYIEELFGARYTFRAGTLSALAEKTAYGYVRKYLDEKNMILSHAEINRLVKGCVGVKRTTGQHPGGIIVVPREYEVYDFTPVQRPADHTESNIVTTHFDFHSLHETLLKLDILGHDDPTMFRMLETLTGITVNEIPVCDEKVMSLFGSTESLGIIPEAIGCEMGVFGLPELGTRFARQMVLEAKPKTFFDLIQIMGLSHGESVWLGNAQELIKKGICTISEVIGTRDSIMVNLMYQHLPAGTAFKIMEDVRRGKGLKEEYESVMKEYNVPGWYIDSCKKIKYMFPKAHAAAYAISALRIGWFKVYYPKEYYTAYFTVKADDFDVELMCKGPEKVKCSMEEIEKLGNEKSIRDANIYTILEIVLEMYARGIQFEPVDIYLSDAEMFLVTPDGIRPSLNSLKGVGTSVAKSIVEARREGIFSSVDDFRRRARLSKTVVEVLKSEGCLQGIPESNQISIFDGLI